jgi:hypothetical protein
MTDFDYPEPVSRLLTLGQCRRMDNWFDYLALGICPEHVSDLIRMMQDDELNQADSQSLEVWAPVHAWRALGQLRAEAAIEPLIGLMEQIDENYEQWIGEEIPEILGMIGPAATPKLAKCLTTPHEGMWAQTTASFALAEIGNRHPEARDGCVSALTRGLENYAAHDPGLNGFLINNLVDLEAVEAAPLMQEAFAANHVDISIMGDWEDVQIRLGLLDERQTPVPQYIQLPGLLPGLVPQASPPAAQSTPEPQWKEKRETERRRQDTRKAKRKRQKEARRKQRKRK